VEPPPAPAQVLKPERVSWFVRVLEHARQVPLVLSLLVYAT
jgi:hypothetical protein